MVRVRRLDGGELCLSGLIDWRLAGLFIAGGLVGGLIGIALGKLIGAHDKALRTTFASVVVLVGVYVCIRGAIPLL